MAPHEHGAAAPPPFRFHAGDVSAIVTCTCRLGNDPMHICSVAMEAQCRHCRRIYGIAAAQYVVGGAVQVSVGVRMPEPVRHVAGVPVPS